MPTLTQKKRRLQFWYRAATTVLFLGAIGSYVFGLQSEPDSLGRKVYFSMSGVLLVQFLFLLVKVTRQLKEINRTGDPELLDDAYREHVIDKDSYVYKNQVKTWMWVMTLSLIVLVVLGGMLLMAIALYLQGKDMPSGY